jgi:imidazolonepropionase-like amidohydrolase
VNHSNRFHLLALAIAAACGAPQAAPAPAPAPTGRIASGADVTLALHDGRIAALAPSHASPHASPHAFLWPPVVDSHVHLSYWPVADRLAAAGVEAVVDLGAPEATLDGATTSAAPIDVLRAGPLLTRPGGYPLDAWGADGFGIGCADAACVAKTVDRLAAHGARVIKLALGDTDAPLCGAARTGKAGPCDDGLDPALIPVACAAAHRHRLRVAVHALTDASARAAAAGGADILAHTPVEPLSAATVAAWRGRAVISTLAAFGGSPPAIDNLRRLRAAGVTVLYGTDLGNTRDAGPSADEIALLRKAGLDDAAITAAMTTTPIAYWGLDLGIARGAEATLLVLDGDPRHDARVLLHPRAVWSRGRRLR